MKSSIKNKGNFSKKFTEPLKKMLIDCEKQDTNNLKIEEK
jgi:hypothetical protein